MDLDLSDEQVMLRDLLGIVVPTEYGGAARVTEIHEGTSEAQRLVIARSVLEAAE